MTIGDVCEHGSLRRSCLICELLAEVARLRDVLTTISEIRNSIVGTQTVNWSAHIYPMVAALDEAGFVGKGYEEARAEAKTLIDERDEARNRIAVLEAALADMCELAVAAAATAFSDHAEAELRERIAAARALLEVTP